MAIQFGRGLKDGARQSWIPARVRANLRARLYEPPQGPLVLLVFAHMLRVFFTGAYKKPRELNWLTGVLLLLITMGFGFTGYLLPWDQKAYWATKVGTDIAGSVPLIGHFLLVSLRGGDQISAATLGRFFDLHVLVLPAIIVILLLGHFFMIRRHGISGRL